MYILFWAKCNRSKKTLRSIQVQLYSLSRFICPCFVFRDYRFVKFFQIILLSQYLENNISYDIMWTMVNNFKRWLYFQTKLFRIRSGIFAYLRWNCIDPQITFLARHAVRWTCWFVFRREFLIKSLFSWWMNEKNDNFK